MRVTRVPTGVASGIRPLSDGLNHAGAKIMLDVAHRVVPTRSRPHVLSGQEIGDEVVRRVEQVVSCSALDEVIEESIYSEGQRLAHTGSDTRANLDREFVSKMRHDLFFADAKQRRALVRLMVRRYVQEIGGSFDRRVYEFTIRLLPPALSLFLHGRGAGPHVFDLGERIVIEGETYALKKLAKIATVILVPTHVSNLDSLVLGSIISRLGLPPFAYGAGLNLFSNAVTGFFMRHLGAYTIDRQKTDPLYRRTLKEYVTVLLEHGQHNLLFPGGTRSRSGAIETHIKKGLLGTAPVAFRNNIARGRRRGVFVLPCTITYPLVLEASSLIENYLRTEGGARYVDVPDEFDSPRRWLDFFHSLRELDERVYVRFSRPLDWLGNDVDECGLSYDSRGRAVDVARYLVADGELVHDAARDAEYTRLLADRIQSRYLSDNTALPTTLVAFVIFEILRKSRERQDLFSFLRNLGPELGVAEEDVLSNISRASAALAELESKGQLRRNSEVRAGDAKRILNQALTTFAMYHQNPIVTRDGNKLFVGDANLLFYYRNRLEGYGLSNAPNLLLGTRSQKPRIARD